MNIFKKILKQSEYSNKKILLDNQFTYKDLHKLILEYSVFLKSKLKTGEIICLILPYSIDFMAIMVSARINGNTLCVLNPDQTDFEKNYILNKVNN